MFNIECEQNTLTELTEAFRFNDHVMRHLVIRRDEAITDVSVLAQEKVKEDERKAKVAATLTEQPVESAPADSEE
jgi:small subunit ribosomal protein S6